MVRSDICRYFLLSHLSLTMTLWVNCYYPCVTSWPKGTRLGADTGCLTALNPGPLLPMVPSSSMPLDCTHLPGVPCLPTLMTTLPQSSQPLVSNAKMQAESLILCFNHRGVFYTHLLSTYLKPLAHSTPLAPVLEQTRQRNQRSCTWRAEPWRGSGSL